MDKPWAQRRRRQRDWIEEEDWEDFRRKAAAEMESIGLSAEDAEAQARLKQSRVAIRLAWLRDRFDAFLAAQDAAEAAFQRWSEACDRGERDGVEESGDSPEQDLCDALYDEMVAARDHGRWPRHLHFHMV